MRRTYVKKNPLPRLPRMLTGSARRLSKAIQAGTITPNDTAILVMALASMESAYCSMRLSSEELARIESPAFQVLARRARHRASQVHYWCRSVETLLARLPRGGPR